MANYPRHRARLDDRMEGASVIVMAGAIVILGLNALYQFKPPKRVTPMQVQPSICVPSPVYRKEFDV